MLKQTYPGSWLNERETRKGGDPSTDQGNISPCCISLRIARCRKSNQSALATSPFGELPLAERLVGGGKFPLKALTWRGELLLYHPMKPRYRGGGWQQVTIRRTVRTKPCLRGVFRSLAAISK